MPPSMVDWAGCRGSLGAPGGRRPGQGPCPASSEASSAPRQLLVAHVRFTIAINTKAREQLICEYGLFDKVGASSRPMQGSHFPKPHRFPLRRPGPMGVEAGD